MHAFEGSPSVKDVIESLGVPHTEVDLVLADGASVDFGWRLRDGVRVSVYPVFESLAVAAVTRVRAEPLRELRFVADGHLGRLARHLRMAGFDVLWERDAADAALARASREEGRILLTRDRGLLKRSAVTHGYCVREADPPRQLAEVIRRFDLARSAAPFRRCLRCNALLEPVREEAVRDRLPPRVRERQSTFTRCPACLRVYWPGSHHRRMEELLAEALRRAAEEEDARAPPDG